MEISETNKVKILGDIIEHCAYYLYEGGDKYALRPSLILFDVATLLKEKYPDYSKQVERLACDLSGDRVTL